MADSAAFKPAPASNDRIAVAPRANKPLTDAQASRPRPARGPLRPSQVPVPGETARRTGSSSPAGGRAHHQRQRLRPSGAPAGATIPLARPSTVPARPIPDPLHGSGQLLAAPLKEEMEARPGADFRHARGHAGRDHALGRELPPVMRQRQGPAASRSPAQQVGQVLSSPGRPLRPDLGSSIGEAFSADFSAVRIHDGPDAAASARAVGASMYTSGTHIVVGGDHPEFGSPGGRRALAHELYHVKQQSEGPVGGTRTDDGLAISDPSDPCERAAERAAEHIASPSGPSARPRDPAGAAWDPSATPVHRNTSTPGPLPSAPGTGTVNEQRTPGGAAAATTLQRQFTGKASGKVIPVEEVADVVNSPEAAADKGRLMTVTGIADVRWVVRKIAEGPDVPFETAADVVTAAVTLKEGDPKFFDKQEGKAARRIHRIVGQMRQKRAALETSKSKVAQVAIDSGQAVIDATDAYTKSFSPDACVAVQKYILAAIAKAKPEFEQDPRNAWLAFSLLSQFGPLSYALIEHVNKSPAEDEPHGDITAGLRDLRMFMAGKEQVGVVAHRGSGPTNRTMGGLIAQEDKRRKNRPAENSPEAFENAFQSVSVTGENEGLDGVECDVFLSSDGVPIVSHEGNVKEQLSAERQRQMASEFASRKEMHEFTADELVKIQRTESSKSRFMTLQELIGIVMPVAQRYYDRTGRAFRLEIEMKGWKDEKKISDTAKQRLKGGDLLRNAVAKDVSKAKKAAGPFLPIEFVLFNGELQQVTGFHGVRQQKSALGDITVGLNVGSLQPSEPALQNVDEMRFMLKTASEITGYIACWLEKWIVTAVFSQEFAPMSLTLRDVEPSKEVEYLKTVKKGKTVVSYSKEVQPDIDARIQRALGQQALTLDKLDKSALTLDERALIWVCGLVSKGDIDIRRFRLLTDYPSKANFLKTEIGKAAAEKARRTV